MAISKKQKKKTTNLKIEPVILKRRRMGMGKYEMEGCEVGRYLAGNIFGAK